MQPKNNTPSNHPSRIGDSATVIKITQIHSRKKDLRKLDLCCLFDITVGEHRFPTAVLHNTNTKPRHGPYELAHAPCCHRTMAAASLYTLPSIPFYKWVYSQNTTGDSVSDYHLHKNYHSKNSTVEWNEDSMQQPLESRVLRAESSRDTSLKWKASWSNIREGCFFVCNDWMDK